jgi:hypothetical protein
VKLKGYSDDGTNERHCLKCGTSYGADVLICTKCGVNLETGHPVQTVVEADSEVPEAPADEREEEEPSAPMQFLMAVGEVFPGLFNPLTLILFPVSVVVALGLAWLALFILSLGALFGGIALGGVALMAYALGVAALLTGRIGTLTDALVELTSTQWTIFIVMVFGPVALIWWLVAGLLKLGGA